MAGNTPRHEENDKDLSYSDEVGSNDADGPPKNTAAGQTRVINGTTVRYLI